MNFSECLSNSNKHLLAVKAFYARCLNSADTASSATLLFGKVKLGENSL